MIAGALEVQIFAGLARLQKDMDNATRIVGGATGRIESFAASASKALDMIGVSAGVAGFARIIKSSIDAADAMNDLRIKTGLTFAEVAKFTLLANQSGTSIEGVAKAIKSLQKYMIEHGDQLQKIGVTSKDTNKALGQFADVVAGIKDPALRTALATKVLGDRIGQEMIPMLLGGSKAFNQAAEASDAYAKQMEIVAPLADEFNDSLAVLGVRAKTAGASLLADLLPTLVEMAKAAAAASRETDLFSASLVGLGRGGIVLQTFAVLVNNLGFIFRVMVNDAVAGMMQLGNVLMLRFDDARKIGEQAAAYASSQRAQLDELDAKILGLVSATAGQTKATEQTTKANDAAVLSIIDVKNETEKAAKSAEDYAAKLLEEAQAAGMDEVQHKMLEAARKAQEAPTQKLSMKIMQAAQAWAIETNAIKERIEAGKKFDAQVDAEIDRLNKAAEAHSDSLGAADKMARELEAEGELIGMTNQQREEAILLRKLETEGINLSSDELEKYKARVISASRANNEQKEALESQVSVWKSIEQTAHDTFVSILDGGKNFAQRLRDTFKNVLFDWLYQMTAKKWIVNLAGSFSGSAVAGQAFGSQAGGGIGSNVIGNAVSNYATSAISSSVLGSSAAYGLATGTSGMQAAMLASQTAEFGMAGLGLTAEAAGTAAGSMYSGLAAMGPWGWAAMAAMALLASGAFKKPGNEWGGVFVDPAATGDAGLRDRIVQTHGKDALFKAASGLELGGTWKRTDGEQTGAALTAMKGIDAALYGITNADMSGKLSANFYGYDKKRGGFRAGDKTGLASMDEVLAQFTRDWVDAAGTVEQINKDLVAGVTGTSEEVLKKTIGILSMTQADMDKLFGESITVDKIKAVAKSGESAGDAFTRLAPVFSATSRVAEILGKDASTAFGAAGLASSEARERLVKLAGGLDALTASTASYYDLYYSDAEKQARLTSDLQEEFAKINTVMPTSKAEFRKLVEGIDLSTESGAKFYAGLMKLAPAFAAVTDATEAARDRIITVANDAVDAALAAVAKSIDAEKKAVAERAQIAADAARVQVDAIRSVFDEISEALNATATEVTRSQAQGTIAAALAHARAGGSLVGFAGLSDALRAIQQPSKQLFSTSVDWQRDQAKTASSLRDLKGSAGDQLSVAEMTLRAIETSSQAQLDALDAQLEAARASVDQLRGINVGVLSVGQAIESLARAIAAAKLAEAPDVGLSPAAGGARVVSPGGVVQGRDPLRDATIVSMAQGGDVTGAIALGAKFGYSPVQLANAWNEATGGGASASGIVDWARANGVPGFATGGVASGWAVVGERGPELANFGGGARIYSNGDSLDLVEEIRALREEVARLRYDAAQTAKNTRRSADLFETVTEGGSAMITTPA